MNWVLGVGVLIALVSALIGAAQGGRVLLRAAREAKQQIASAGISKEKA